MLIYLHNVLYYRLEQAFAFRQFSAGVDEEETWIQEKEHLLSASDFGNVLAIVQVKSLVSFCSLYAILVYSGANKTRLYV